MIDDQEEYEVEQVISHWYHGHKKTLQYLIQWKGYSVTDDTWEPADQVFADALVRVYHRKHPLKGKEAGSFANGLRMALAKSHWHPHNPLMNFGVTGPTTKQDCTGAPKISAPMVPIVSGTTKNMSTPTHHVVTQPTKTNAKADASEKNALRKSIHRALIKFFSCLETHNLPCSLIVPTIEPKTAAQCSVPSNALRLWATITPTLIHGQYAFMEESASSSPKTFPTSTPVHAALWKPTTTLMPPTGCYLQLWSASKAVPSRWRKPLPSSSVVV